MRLFFHLLQIIAKQWVWLFLALNTTFEFPKMPVVRKEHRAKSNFFPFFRKTPHLNSWHLENLNLTQWKTVKLTNSKSFPFCSVTIFIKKTWFNRQFKPLSEFALNNKWTHFTTVIITKKKPNLKQTINSSVIGK